MTQTSADAALGVDPGDDSCDERDRAVTELRSQIVLFKRTLHLVRSSTATPELGPSGLPLLGALRRLGPQRTTTLAAEVFLDPSTVSRQVDALVRSGYVEKVADPDDRRASLVQLTESGRAALAAHLDAIGVTLQGLLAGWSVGDLRALSALLGRLNSDVHARIPDSPSGPAA